MIEFAEIVEAELTTNGIRLCRGGCHHWHSHTRGFAAPEERTIHYNAQFKTRSTLHVFLHEMGHIVANKPGMKRWEREKSAEDYARMSLRALGIPVPRKAVRAGRAYVARMKQWGRNIAAGRAR